MKKLIRIIALALCISLATCVTPSASAAVLNEPIKDSGIITLLKAVRPLTTIATVMNTAAHPDDEGSNWLAALSLGEGVSTHVVTITRGQGGQNAIGPEVYNAMGVLRTEELTKSVTVLDTTVDFARIDFDSPCMDFGFSKKWEETEEKWNFDYVTERFVYFIREYRPEIVVLPFKLDRTQHGHHQSIIICTLLAVEAAADPTRYPEQGLPAFKVSKVYEPANAQDEFTAPVNTGKFDPWYGTTYQVISDYARSFHACQGMGGQGLPQPGTRLLHLNDEAESPYETPQSEDSIFAGLPYDFNDYAELVGDADIAAQLKKIQSDAEAIEAAFPHNAQVLAGVYAMQGDVEQALSAVAASDLDPERKYDLTFHLEKKITQLARTAAAAAAVEILVVPEDMEVAPGQTINVAVRVHQGTDAILSVEDVTLNLPQQDQWTVEKGEATGELGPNLTYIQNFTVTAPKTADYYNAFHADGISAAVAFGGEKAFSWYGKSEGNFAYVPEFSVAVTPEKAAVNLAKGAEPVTFGVTVTNNTTGADEGELTLAGPEGWTIEPASAKLSFAKGGESTAVSFTLTPPEGVAEGEYTFLAQVQGSELVSNQTVQTIDYQHIDKTYYIYSAEGAVQVFPVEFDSELKIGYIESGNDTVADTLKVLGMNVTLLTDDDVRFGDLSAYDTIITGVRAYRYRSVLAECYDRLLKYVEAGGNLVVQYHTSGDGYKPEYAPYPFKIGSPSLEWRVTYEDSPVTVLLPDNALLNSPNVITDSDWDGWIQERSLYVPMEWDERYEAPIRSGLVEQENREYDGQILTAKYGEGTFTYTAIVFFRQVTGLVPGGVRLFANMINR
ncbi:MAG: PIG-L family deacetylase [Oscillospiraceae bacterium]|jgi:LmbE family N-acetylglucosaminyl deacetylase|nr:PIG-L family deacetylase [Oscillospiraceae bacterium]